MVGRGGQVEAWILLEHNGPWPATAPDGVVDPGVLAEARRRAPGVRVQLIRSAERPRVTRPLALLAWTSGTNPWVEARRLGSEQELLDVDLEALARGAPVGFGKPVYEPFLTVCTHGKKDPCCAEFGRPALRALSVALAGRVWETTHLGGDRFAANALVFPYGLCYGRVGPTDALALARCADAGEVHLPNLRGRTSLSPAAQVAEYQIRRATGLTGLTDVSVEDVAESDGQSVVQLASSVGRFEVALALVDEGVPGVGSCGSGATASTGRWVARLVRHVEAAAAADVA
ncbi:sucrase ferredoxin [Egibacter rhizosphaerae]|uniref:Sucrase ferredoxin n=1 Tax=Egibacter rhizosphaerae TaxID=1670831 RepID=A0A411YB64_9ACTN|nr:sucrase ferredoxin [Egibacter rhizosphaerae]QBI18450.1 sucrase ferredoxin [Egibacter rhizosphaerae]